MTEEKLEGCQSDLATAKQELETSEASLARLIEEITPLRQELDTLRADKLVILFEAFWIHFI